MLTHPDDLWLLDVPFSRWETVLLLDPSSYETATQSVGNPRQRNQASRRKKKGRKTHTSIPLIIYSTLFGMRLIKEGWYHLLAPGPEVTDRSSEVTDRSWLNHSHNNAAKGMSPPTRRFVQEGTRNGSYRTTPINPYVSLLTSYMTRDRCPARPNTVSHPYFCKDTAHETSHVCFQKNFNVSMRFNFDSVSLNFVTFCPSPRWSTT